MIEIFLNSIQLLFTTIIGKILLVLIPLTLPFMLIYVFWVIRFRWITMRFVEKQKNALLEIKLPKEILKSPAGMEIFFSYLGQSGGSTYADIYLDGKTRPWFSCEIVSVGGDVRFFVWCSQAALKSVVEAQLYAQYPNIEIHEVKAEDDYTRLVHFDMNKFPMYALNFGLTKSDPFPIKTYIDYGLDKDTKDEYKIDPMNSVIEFLGSLKKGENAWIQILVQKHEKEGWKQGVMKRDAKNLKNEIKEAIEEIKGGAILKKSSNEEKAPTFLDLSKGESEIVAALERSAGKPAFDCMVRGVYIAEKESFNPTNIGGVIGCFRQYSSNSLNGFKLGYNTDVSTLSKDIARFIPIPFLNRRNAKIRDFMRMELLHAYKLRSFFQWPYKHHGSKPFILTSEELATIFHFPSGIVSQTPTLKRVESKKHEAPSNLPI
jgi:hypothetical protein